MNANKRPNILILYTDQQRKDSLQCYGNPVAVTPNIDKLAEEGARFNRFFVQNPVCMPSRMTFLTGRYCSSLGVGTNGVEFPEKEAMPINKILKVYGYTTANLGKLHFRNNENRNYRNVYPDYKELGFDVFVSSEAPDCDDSYLKWLQMSYPDRVDQVVTDNDKGISDYSVYKKTRKDADRKIDKRSIEAWGVKVFEEDESLSHSSFVAAETVQFIESHNPKQPFFAIAGFYAPHALVNPPRKYIDLYKPEEMGIPIVGDDEQENSVAWQYPDEEWQKIRTYYYALVTHIDDCVGRILKGLERSGQADNTIVIFTSDHGEYLGDHGRVAKGMPGHDCIINVPFIIRYPEKIKKGLVVDQMVEAVDIVPTLLDYCYIPIPDDVQGRSVKGLLEEKKGKHREDILVEMFTDKGQRSTTVRTEKYKYNLTQLGDEILYDLVNDPNELRNVAGLSEYAQALSDMRKRAAVRIQAAFHSRKKEAAY